MEKTIAAFEARRKFGKILQEVAGKGDRFVVERHGEPVAAVVPMEVYENWKRQRTEFFDLIRAMQQEADLDPECQHKRCLAETVAFHARLRTINHIDLAFF